MNILLIEDESVKKDSLIALINSVETNDEKKIDYVKSLASARRKILSEKFDLIIFDIYLPLKDGNEHSVDVSEDILSDFNHSINYQTESIAITKYEIVDIENIESFNELGITVVHYNENSDTWKDSLKQKIAKLSDKASFDFLIFCALSKERDAYEKSIAEVGEKKIIKGLDCQEVTIEGRKGLCIQPARMGLVNMAITASKAIEYFQPKLVAMSGICAGVKGESNYLDLIIGDTCWEYQTGKYKNKRFVQEPYQVSLDSSIKTELSHFISNEQIISKFKEGLYCSELSVSGVVLGPLSSGSAVIADEKKMEEIGLQHRKLKAIEMEMYALYEAANQSLSRPIYFGVKSVVDLGDTLKDDAFHGPACVLSARFVAEFIKHKLCI